LVGKILSRQKFLDGNNFSRQNVLVATDFGDLAQNWSLFADRQGICLKKQLSITYFFI